jgi:hypothetical protein
MEQKLDHRLPQGELTLALLGEGGYLGQGLSLPFLRQCSPLLDPEVQNG